MESSDVEDVLNLIREKLMMIKMLEPFLQELRQESGTTRKVLERVPTNKLAWKPHEKSMSIGTLAWHIANVPGGITKAAAQDEVDIGGRDPMPKQPESTEEILAAHDASIKTAEEYLENLSEATALGNFSLKLNGKVMFSGTRVSVIRTLMLNHTYHHRGQLSVYLRMLDVPVPIIYGRSADEVPS